MLFLIKAGCAVKVAFANAFICAGWCVREAIRIFVVLIHRAEYKVITDPCMGIA